MSGIAATTTPVDSTSANGAMLSGQQRVNLLLCGPFVVGVTTTDVVIPWESSSTRGWNLAGTTSGFAPVPSIRSGSAIGELRRLSGLTWEQLAHLVGVSRRTLHFWASGKEMGPANQEHLQRILGVLRRIDRGTARENRRILLESGEDGLFATDLLANKRYELVVSLLGPGGAARVSSPRLSSEALAARRPRPPQDLVAALQTPIHREKGTPRAARTVRRTIGG